MPDNVTDQPTSEETYVSVQNAHGIFVVESYRVDMAVERYLPNSMGRLRSLYAEMGGDYPADVYSIVELVVMLADVSIGHHYR